MADAVPIPVIASGGVGHLDHLAEGVLRGHASAVLAASIFHFGEYTIRQAKERMAARGHRDAARLGKPSAIPAGRLQSCLRTVQERFERSGRLSACSTSRAALCSLAAVLTLAGLSAPLTADEVEIYGEARRGFAETPPNSEHQGDGRRSTRISMTATKTF